MTIQGKLIRGGLVFLLAAPLTCVRPPAPVVGPIPVGPAAVDVQTVASGLVSPVYLTGAGDGSDRLFIVDQIGLVRLFTGGQLVAQPFLDVRSRLVSLSVLYDERGLLGLAFHPGFGDANSPGFRRLYTYQTEPAGGPADFTEAMPSGARFDHQNVVTEWQVDPNAPDTVDPHSARDVMRIDHPQSNHNGGQLLFGPDGLLYIGSGDGGAGNDVGAGHSPQGNGQDTTNVLGKILRIDPLPPMLTSAAVGPAGANGQYRVPADNPFVAGGGLPEIFAYGFRNPYQFSFDAATGDLIAGDVGQNTIEEVDIVVKGGNYGWPIKEGTFLFNRQTGVASPDSPGKPTDLIDPVLEYDHTQGEAVIGGFVYRGSAIPALVGLYIFGDLQHAGAGRLFYGDLAAGQIRALIVGPDNGGLGVLLKGFGADRQGELYALGSPVLGPAGTGGVVRKLIPAAAASGP
jgi:glucose/arabinose dehydrogenase